MKLYVPVRPLIGREIKLVMFSPASRNTSSRLASSTPGPVTSGMSVNTDSYSTLASARGLASSRATSARGASAEEVGGGLVVLDGGADAGDVVQFAADGGTEGDFAWDKVPAGRRVGCGRLWRADVRR